jgi:hypothetical protein
VDTETRRKKQRALMLKLVERKVRSRAEQLYQTRGESEGHALQDWVQAETEVLGNTVLAPMYRRLRSETPESEETGSPEAASADLSAHATQDCSA